MGEGGIKANKANVFKNSFFEKKKKEKVKVRSSKPLVIKLKVEVKVLSNLNRA